MLAATYFSLMWGLLLHSRISSDFSILWESLQKGSTAFCKCTCCLAEPSSSVLKLTFMPFPSRPPDYVSHEGARMWCSFPTEISCRFLFCTVQGRSAERRFYCHGDRPSKIISACNCGNVLKSSLSPSSPISQVNNTSGTPPSSRE